MSDHLEDSACALSSREELSEVAFSKSFSRWLFCHFTFILLDLVYQICQANFVVNCRFINSLVKSGDSSKNYWQKYNFGDGDYCEAQVGVFYLLLFKIQGFSSTFLLLFSPANSLLLLFFAIALGNGLIYSSFLLLFQI